MVCQSACTLLALIEADGNSPTLTCGFRSQPVWPNWIGQPHECSGSFQRGVAVERGRPGDERPDHGISAGDGSSSHSLPVRAELLVLRGGGGGGAWCGQGCLAKPAEAAAMPPRGAIGLGPGTGRKRPAGTRPHTWPARFPRGF